MLRRLQAQLLARKNRKFRLIRRRRCQAFAGKIEEQEEASLYRPPPPSFPANR